MAAKEILAAEAMSRMDTLTVQGLVWDIDWGVRELEPRPRGMHIDLTAEAGYCTTIFVIGRLCLVGGATVSRAFPNLAFYECSPDERESLFLPWHDICVSRFDTTANRSEIHTRWQ